MSFCKSAERCRISKSPNLIGKEKTIIQWNFFGLCHAFFVISAIGRASMRDALRKRPVEISPRRNRRGLMISLSNFKRGQKKSRVDFHRIYRGSRSPAPPRSEEPLSSRRSPFWPSSPHWLTDAIPTAFEAFISVRVCRNKSHHLVGRDTHHGSFSELSRGKSERRGLFRDSRTSARYDCVLRRKSEI